MPDERSETVGPLAVTVTDQKVIEDLQAAGDAVQAAWQHYEECLRAFSAAAKVTSADEL